MILECPTFSSHHAFIRSLAVFLTNPFLARSEAKQRKRSKQRSNTLRCFISKPRTMPLHSNGSSRFLRVDTQSTPPRTAAPRRSASPNKQPPVKSPGFMQSTAASHGQNINPYSDENDESAGLALEKMKANLARFTKSGYVLVVCDRHLDFGTTRARC